MRLMSACMSRPLWCLIAALGTSVPWNAVSPADEENAGQAMKPLEARFANAKADRETLRRDLVAFRCARPGTANAFRAAVLLTKLPSPLDSLDAGKLALGDRKDLPDAVVAILLGHTRPLASLAWAPDGVTLASAAWDNSIRFWRCDGATVSASAVLRGGPSALAFAGDGKTLASGRTDSQVQLWDVSGTEPRPRAELSGHTYRPFALAFTPNAKMLVTGCFDPTLRLWDLRGREPDGWSLFTGEGAGPYHVASLAISRDGRLLATASAVGRRILRVWRIDGNLLEELDLPELKAQHTAFSPERNTLAFCGDGFALLWDFEKDRPRERARLKVDATVNALAFGPDGATLAAGTKDGKVLLWDAAQAKSVQDWAFPVAVNALAFAPDGRHLAVGAADGRIYLARLKKGA
jgi:WD40 repeat protein